MENYESKPVSELETNTNIMELKKINPRFKGEKKKGRRKLLGWLGMFVGLPVCGVAVGVPTTIAYIARKRRIWMPLSIEELN